MFGSPPRDSFAGILNYMAPEMYQRRDRKYDTKLDIWFLGCVPYELVTLKTALQANDFYVLKRVILKGGRDQHSI